MITSGFQVGRTGFRPDGKEKGKVETAKNGDAKKGIPQHIPKKMANQELSKGSELKEVKNEKKRKWDQNSIIKGRDGLRRKGSEKKREAQKRRDFLDKKTISKSVVKRKKNTKGKRTLLPSIL